MEFYRIGLILISIVVFKQFHLFEASDDAENEFEDDELDFEDQDSSEEATTPAPTEYTEEEWDYEEKIKYDQSKALTPAQKYKIFHYGVHGNSLSS